MRYRQTLPIGERHLVGRLESFGDIVIGFSLSQLALQLEIPKTPADVFAHPLKYAVFFGAFAIVATFWLRFHRIMSTGFAPRRLDMLLLFAFLSFVALVPFSLITYTRLVGPGSLAREAMALYLGDFIGIAAFSWVLSIRGLRRAWSVLDDRERRDAWRPVLGGFFIVPVLLLTLAAVPGAGSYAFVLLLLLVPLVRVGLRLVPRPWAFVLGPQPPRRLGTLEAAAES
ncbi:MAG TPA: TMEM175 family protein [Candidatus Elarobacter sp.]|nr:TMEM175 family protein [Candidatus Elarobacter sp.]